MTDAATTGLDACLRHVRDFMPHVLAPGAEGTRPRPHAWDGVVRGTNALSCDILRGAVAHGRDCTVSPVGLSAALAVAHLAAGGATREFVALAATGSRSGDPVAGIAALVRSMRDERARDAEQAARRAEWRDKDRARNAEWMALNNMRMSDQERRDAFGDDEAEDPDTSSDGLSLATFVATRADLEVAPGFRAATEQLDARWSRLPDAEATPVELNAWIAERTHGLVPDMLGPLHPLLRAVLGSTVFYRRAWSKTFKKELTAPLGFATTGGIETVPTMRDMVGGVWSRGADASALRVDLGHAAEAIMVLPHDGASGPVVQETHLGGFLALPRMELASEIDLAGALRDLGLGALFSRDGDLSGLSGESGLHFGAARQDAVLRVDEDGVLGAAVTLFAPVAGCAPPTERPVPFVMVLDRPFLFIVREYSTGAIVFMTWVRDPGTRDAGTPGNIVPGHMAHWLERDGAVVPRRGSATA